MSVRLRRTFAVLLGLLLALVVVTPAMAAPVTYSFNAVITLLEDPTGAATGKFGLGDTVQGTVTWDPAAPDTWPQADEGGYFGTGFGLDMTVNGYRFRSDPAVGSHSYVYNNAAVNHSDQFYVEQSPGIQDVKVAGATTGDVNMSLADSSMTVLSSDALPSSLTLSRWDVHRVEFLSDNGTNRLMVYANITSLTPVAAPRTSTPASSPWSLAILAAVGCVLFVVARRTVFS